MQKTQKHYKHNELCIIFKCIPLKIILQAEKFVSEKFL